MYLFIFLFGCQQTMELRKGRSHFREKVPGCLIQWQLSNQNLHPLRDPKFFNLEKYNAPQINPFLKGNYQTKYIYWSCNIINIMKCILYNAEKPCIYKKVIIFLKAQRMFFFIYFGSLDLWPELLYKQFSQYFVNCLVNIP